MNGIGFLWKTRCSKPARKKRGKGINYGCGSQRVRYSTLRKWSEESKMRWTRNLAPMKKKTMEDYK